MQLQGSLVRDISRARVGRVRDVLLDPDTLQARWLQITLDADETTVLVPAASASEAAPGELLVPYPATTIAAAVHDAAEVLTEDDAAALLRHYGFPG